MIVNRNFLENIQNEHPNSFMSETEDFSWKEDHSY